MIKNKESTASVYILRACPFHNGHASVLERALKKSKFVVILIGSPFLARSLKTPFTFEERKQMIEDWIKSQPDLAYAQYVIKPARNYPYNNALWARNVQNIVKNAIIDSGVFSPDAQVSISITGSERDESTWYLRAFPQWQLDLVEPYAQGDVPNVNATDIRTYLFDTEGSSSVKEYFKLLPNSTKEFLKKFCFTSECEALSEWYMQNKRYLEAAKAYPYPPIYQTVDCVVVQSGHVLVVKRGANPGYGLWALPGGFLNVNERLRDGAIRELLEETGIRLAEGKKSAEITKEILNGSIRARDVFDMPDRSERGRTITTAYYFRLDDTKPLPKVKGQFVPSYESGGKEIVETLDAFWIPINEALNRSDMWFEDHHAILETMIGGVDY